MITMNKSYSELKHLLSFKERFEYLKLDGYVGQETFGFDRYLNQKFYKSPEWKRIRSKIILRDYGCNLGLKDFPIYSKIIIHHMNPIDTNDIKKVTDELMNPDYLICVDHKTHNAIHYGSDKILDPIFVERQEGDTDLWIKHI